MKILIIDDEINIRLLLTEIFKLVEYETKEASNGQMGLELLEQDTFDLIILDQRMPVMNGEVTLAKIREKFDVPVIMISAFQTKAEVDQLLALGANEVVMKPFDIQELLKIVKNYTNS
ncbi:response regulator [Macrococcus sp. DPC7161]|uniref:response regulator n=1 Tax=Macrococcus sp. DPC7161 TaxID=2507060 RepID=UPI00100C0A5E|nr:response regulator [Macrococcus sp. DPC7161]RXK17576.1 response regulator [Macrococcus sp. DPC7161]